jgi:hypothetical protein
MPMTIRKANERRTLTTENKPQPKRRADGSAPSEAWTPSASLCARKAQRDENLAGARGFRGDGEAPVRCGALTRYNKYDVWAQESETKFSRRIWKIQKSYESENKELLIMPYPTPPSGYK